MCGDPNQKAKDLLDELDFEAIPDLDDKVRECEFFFKALSEEKDRDKFRWFLSAYMNSAYSYFETMAVRAHEFFLDRDTGNPVICAEILEELGQHVGINGEDYKKLKTSGHVKTTQILYNYRKHNTHHFSLPIRVSGTNLPEDFFIGSRQNKGVRAMPFCRDLLQIIQNSYQSIDG